MDIGSTPIKRILSRSVLPAGWGSTRRTARPPGQPRSRRPPANAGVQAMITGAGMAAHLGEAMAARTILRVSGVPLAASLGGLDALLATVQVPPVSWWESVPCQSS